MVVTQAPKSNFVFCPFHAKLADFSRNNLIDQELRFLQEGWVDIITAD
jgi:hypothetical protein